MEDDSVKRFEKDLREITPPDRDPWEFAREFLERYMRDDKRVVGVRFGPQTIVMQITDRSAINNLPAVFHGVRVSLQDFPPPLGDSSAADSGGYTQDGPLADL